MRGRVVSMMVIAILLGIAAVAWWAAISRPTSPPVALRVGVYGNPPKIDTNAKGQPTGLFVELLNAIADKENWTLQYHRCAWIECLNQLEAGQLDLMPDVAYTSERGERFDFHTIPALLSWSQVYSHSGMQLYTFQDLAKKRIAYVGGVIQQTELERLMAGLNLPWVPVPVEDYQDAFRAVEAGQADIALTNSFFGNRYSKRYSLHATPIILNPHSLFIATTKGTHAKELSRIDHWLNIWQQESNSVYFQAIRRVQLPEPDTAVPSWFWPATIGIFLFIIMLTLFSVYLRWRVQTATDESNRSHQRLQRVIEVSPVVLILSHAQGNRLVVDWVSPNIQRLYGLSPKAATDDDWWASRVHPDDMKTLEPILTLLQHHTLATREYRFVDAEGRTHYIHEELRKLPLEPNEPLRVLSSWNDQSESKAHAAELTHLVHYDTLTGLPNRKLLQLYLADAVKAEQPCTLMLVDLDRLRGINDTLGQTVGDQALRATTQRIQARLLSDGFLARHGGDEFAIVLAGIDTERNEAFAQDVLESFTRPLLGYDVSTVLTASIGIALFPSDASDAETLMRHAELALYEAKRLGSGRRQLYEPAFSSGANQRLTLESGLRMALANREFRLYYQPQIDLRDGSLTGVEALLRWQHPELGMVSPTQFIIPVAEEAGMIAEIGQWVLIEACRQLRAWDDAGICVPGMSVNCSVHQLDADRLPTQVTNVLTATGLSPDRLELEITESVLMHEPEQAISVLNALKALGIRLAIDDFGTGYSSLAYLRRMPVSRLKIDRAFVNGIGNDPNDERICNTVISLAQSLGLEVLAEGAEHQHEIDFLRERGDILVQGYYYARPLPPNQFASWYQTRTAYQPM